MRIYALHGFLGLPSDWNRLKEGIEEPFESVNLLSIDLPKNGLQNWGRALNGWVAKQPEEKRILLGYSQGGRLAMHALLNAPHLWAGGIIVSASTGLKFDEERAARMQIDMRWSEKFLNEPWDSLMDEWDSQPVFQGKKSPFKRKEGDYTRGQLADSIIGWSLGKQSDLQAPLSGLPLPILWIAGEKDSKYAFLAKEITAMHPRSSSWIAPDAGHRVPWECPELFLKKIREWMNGAISSHSQVDLHGSMEDI
jgi:2-succinyl-6-hydroxy-2,4-cyclohexadiene-1-carboxylate synthase